MADIQESSVPRLPGEIGNVEICKVEGYFNLQVGQLKITWVFQILVVHV